MTDLEKKFFENMKNIYIRADKECGYRATRFLQMLNEKGGVNTAKILISKPGGTEGFAKLWELGRLELSVEALVIQDEFQELFTQEEIDSCIERLKEYGYIKEQ
ncbi:hypothetical protein EHE19_010755 [Ruminiclostridium herbifermentans]|uniref:Uncharacterized protein n=1 Tax=Ruminiclostridium herbifermentans TaxID=2488810 RepID=A0A4U7JMI8_9FIRM|nr:hypothetical protein [Ruminiclostridium herbifermentans]QNU65417.1 hypothetical protein EHE19_010755 [Ruminiclostridium herbifermentans]